MPEKHQAKIEGSDTKITITDPEPLASARLFKQITDALWSQKPRKNKTSAFSMPAVMNPAEARDEITAVLGPIDSRMILSGVSKKLFLNDTQTRLKQRIAFSPAILATPSTAYIGTYNWDSRATDRQVELDGEREVAVFANGHTDYHRELFVGFGFTMARDEQLGLEYRIQRYQPHQDKPVALDLTAHFSRFGDQGYEGGNLSHTNLTPEQELAVLTTIQRIGNIILPTM